MNSEPLNSENFFKTACYFEAGLILVAILFGWILDVDPFANLFFSEPGILYGIIGTAPLFILFLALNQLKFNSVVEIRDSLLETLGPSLSKCHWSDLFVLAAIAGISEELVFRGVLQPYMENTWGMWQGLIISNIIFGFVHAITPLYAVLATLVGIYLGLYLDYDSQRNLLTPIIIHGLYDFLVFLILVSNYKKEFLNRKDETF